METHGLDVTANGMMFSSGMSAISTLLFSILKKGDKILTQGNLYGGTTELLAKILHPLGIASIMLNLKDLNLVEDYWDPLFSLYIY